MLDTDACIRVLSNSSAALINRLRAQNSDEIALCTVVKAELVSGARRSSRVAENLRLLDRFFEPFLSFPFDDACVGVYGRIRTDLERAGTPIGPYDLMIAAVAIANECAVVTAITREFVDGFGLEVENWEVSG